MHTTIGDVARVCSGVLGGGADPTKEVDQAVIDSRRVSSGALFIAVAGGHSDGHLHVADAAAAGAVAAIVSRPVPVPHILVEDTTVALGALARWFRSTLGARVSAVTGSVGKTSTKDLLAFLLQDIGPTVSSPASYNNDLGLPLTVLAANPDTAHLVVEMGSRAAGDLTRLCRIAQPHTALVLNVGSAHIGEFGSRSAIAEAKAELVEAASELAVLNADDPLVIAMAARGPAEVRTFGAAGDVRAERLRIDEAGRPAFQLVAPEGSSPVRMLMVGAHQVPNALAAAAVALVAGVPVEVVAAGLGRAQPASRWRMEVGERADGVTVVNDAYNANPESTRAAIDALVAMTAARGRRSWAVLGEMLELGEHSRSEHEAVGAYAARRGVNRLLAVGAAAAPMLDGASAGSLHGVWAAGSDDALALLREELVAGDVVLVKASRGAALDVVATSLLGDAPPSAPDGESL